MSSEHYIKIKSKDEFSNDKLSTQISFVAFTLSALLMTGLVSCKDDDHKTPEIVENPLDEDAWYLIGTIMDENGVLPNATVSLEGYDTSVKTDENGYYSIKVVTKKSYTLKMEKEGYVTAYPVVDIPNDAEKQTSYLTNQQLNLLGEDVLIESEKDTVIVLPHENLEVLFHIPANPGADNLLLNFSNIYASAHVLTDVLPYHLFNGQPEGTGFNSAFNYVLKNDLETLTFPEMMHLSQSSALETWQHVAQAQYDAASGYYHTPLSGFSNHGFFIPAEFGKKTEYKESCSDEFVFDNRGNMNAIERQISYTQASGWILESGFKQSLLANSEFTASQAEALYTRIEDMVSLLKGSKPGLIEKNIVSETIKISGDTKLTVQVMKVYHVQHITIRVYCNNKYVPVTIPVLTHISIHISFQTSVGADHSGGGLS